MCNLVRKLGQPIAWEKLLSNFLESGLILMPNRLAWADAENFLGVPPARVFYESVATEPPGHYRSSICHAFWSARHNQLAIILNGEKIIVPDSQSHLPL